MSTPLGSLGQLESALERRPIGLVCDVDGTISELAPTPGDARVSARIQSLLRALSPVAVVAAVSGRNAADVQRLVGVPGLLYVGVHGLVWLQDGREELVPEAEPYRALTRQAAQDLAPLRRLPGVVMEVKTVGLTFHYRLTRDQEATRQAILRAIAGSPAASRFRVQEGILLVELRPPIDVTKGAALRRLTERRALRGVIYLGDDITDIDAFVEARRLREQGGVPAFGIAVAHPEAPESAREAADFFVSGVDDVARLLSAIAKQLGVDPSAAAP